jgi:hypothetical protein
MNQLNPTPQNPWKSPWLGTRGVLLWFLLLGVASFFIILFGSLVWEWADTGFGGTIALAGIAAVLIALVGFLATVGVRWLWCWRRFRWVLFGCACLITLFALAHAVENWRGHHAWKNYQKIAAEKGERFDVAAIIPPAVPDRENFAMAPIFEDVRNEMDREWRRAQSGLDGSTNRTNRFELSVYGARSDSRGVGMGSWMKAERTDLETWQTYYRTPSAAETGSDLFRIDQELASRYYGLEQALPSAKPSADTLAPEFPVAPQPQSPAADVLLALSKFDPIVEELRAANRRPHSRFPVTYEDGFNVLLPHLSKMKGASQFFALRAVASLAEGESEQALEDLKLSFRLVDAIATEPLLISHLVRIAQMHISLQPIWEGLADRRWNEAQLAAIQAELERIDFLADYHLAMRGERAWSIWSVDYLRGTRDVSFFDHWNPSPPVQAGRRLQRLLFRLAMPRGWFEQNKVSMARMHIDLFLPAVDLEARVVSPDALGRLEEAMEEQLKRRTPYNFFAGLLLPALSRAAEKFARIEAAVDLATVACALERFQLAHGEHPKALDELVPRFIAKLPHDIINGQPLKYERTGDGRFLLYSVGWNEIDDDGEVALTKSGRADWNEGDWVWRYPEE